MFESVEKIKKQILSGEKLSNEDKSLLKTAYEEICKSHGVNSKLDTTCSGCVNNAVLIVKNYISEQGLSPLPPFVKMDNERVKYVIDEGNNKVYEAKGEGDNIHLEEVIDETKRPGGTTKEVITDTGSVADNHDLERKGNFTREQLEEMNEDEIKLIAKDKEIKIGRSGKEILIDKILEHGN